jgi:hypothetical protein
MVVIGQYACATRFFSVAIGSCVSALNAGATVIGNGSSAQSEHSIAIGYNMNAISRSVAIGFEGTANGEGAIAFGRSANSSSSCGVAIGYSTCSCHAGAYVLGANLTSCYANTVHTPNLVAFGQGASLIYDLGNWATGGQTVNWDEGNNQKVSIDASVTTLTLSNPIAGGNYQLQLTQGGVGANTITWPGTVKWAGASGPTLSTAVGKIDVVSFLYDGTNYLGTYALNFA